MLAYLEASLRRLAGLDSKQRVACSLLRGPTRATYGAKYHAFRDRDLLARYVHAAADSRLGLIHAAAPQKGIGENDCGSSVLAEAFDALTWHAAAYKVRTWRLKTPRGYTR